jgi:flagellar motor protein MotB
MLEHDPLVEGAPDGAGATPVWAAFGDLMTGVLGAFVLILAFALVMQMDLAQQLDDAQRQRQAEAQRREALEQALAGPLAGGRITLKDGRIGIAGNVLFAPGSDALHDEGRQLLRGLAPGLNAYLAARDEVLMVSGFTDDKQVRGGNRRYDDNWELSALRALTVTRALMADGVPASRVFAAAFGPEQPVASNADAAGRALNRRVEIAPMPRRAGAALAPASAASAP